MAMGCGRQLIAAVVSVGLLGAPCFSAPAPSTQLGIVVFAEHARVGTGPISVGSTVFGGDNVSTESTGTLQIRAGAARLLLANASAATLTREDVSPAAILTTGTATFSTANPGLSPCTFATLRFAQTPMNRRSASFRARSKEMVVRSTRGALAVTVEGETRVIPEGSAFRVVLDPTPAEVAAAGAPAAGGSSAGADPQLARERANSCGMRLALRPCDVLRDSRSGRKPGPSVTSPPSKDIRVQFCSNLSMLNGSGESHARMTAPSPKAAIKKPRSAHGIAGDVFVTSRTLRVLNPMAAPTAANIQKSDPISVDLTKKAGSGQ